MIAPWPGIKRGTDVMIAQAHLARVKFLGSYPVTGADALDRRAEITRARQAASEWIDALRARVRSS